MKNVVISQPRYLPALNYIHRMRFADEFILLNTVQRQARGFENRNKIMSSSGKSVWLSVPISSSSRCLIKETVIANQEWVHLHQKQIQQSYKNYPYYNNQDIECYYSTISDALRATQEFGPVMTAGLCAIAKLFNFDVKFMMASELELDELPRHGAAKLAYLAGKVGADNYVSGPNGREYGIEEVFSETDISVKYHRFDFNLYEVERPILCFWDSLFLLGKERVRCILEQQPEFA